LEPKRDPRRLRRGEDELCVGERTSYEYAHGMAHMAEITEPTPLLVLVDELVQSTDNAVLIPDLRGVATYVLEIPKGEEPFLAPSMIFHVLRDLVADGLLSHTASGYRLTEAGEEEARTFRESDPTFAARAAEAIKTHSIQ
jgi:hypothetical protein